VATGDNAIVPLHEVGDRITAAAGAAIGAGRFVRISANMQQTSPLLDISTSLSPLTGGNLPVVSQCTAGQKAFGVAEWDAAAAGDVLGVYCGHFIVPMVSGAAITAGVEVESDANGAAITLASGKANGIAVNTAVGGVVYVRLYS
jgi:predicted RecA/RadA family phage recombinase